VDQASEVFAAFLGFLMACAACVDPSDAMPAVGLAGGLAGAGAAAAGGLGLGVGSGETGGSNVPRDTWTSSPASRFGEPPAHAGEATKDEWLGPPRRAGRFQNLSDSVDNWSKAVMGDDPRTAVGMGHQGATRWGTIRD